MNAINNRHEIISKRRGLRREATPQEIILWSRLRNNQLGYKFRRQHSIEKYILDFYCPVKKLAIEIDGSQHFFEKSLEYDLTRTNNLSVFGIKVLRFTNADINLNIEGVMLKILGELG